jgi:curli production assembly/transport component CsgG
MKARLLRLAAALAALVFAGGCAHTPSGARDNAQLTPDTAITRDLLALPPPKGKIAVAVYGIRDQTGQYKPAPDSSFSTAVTQGASSLLIRALQDSGWFVPVERENLQNLLTERKIVRALEMPQPAGTPAIQVPPLLAASVLIEGGIVAFESNVRTGGVGARFLGVGLSTQYRVDQVTVNLRTVDIRGGQILQSISTTKTIYSYELHPSVFKFVNVKDLAEFEAGTTRNEPTQLCVTEAIEAAVTHLIAQGVKAGNWTLQDETDRANPVLQRYLGQAQAQRSAMRLPAGGRAASHDISPDVSAGSRAASSTTGGAP